MHYSNRSAFTLVEILVATAITMILTSMILALTTNVLTTWNRSSGKLSSGSDARLALQLLTQDLETAVLKHDGSQWVIAEQDSDVGILPAKNAFWLQFFSPVTDRPRYYQDSKSETFGDICAVSYRLAYQNPFDNPNGLKVYSLYRTVADPQTTFEEALVFANSENQNLKGFWNTGTYKNGKSADEFLVGNVVNFSLIFQYQVTVEDGNTERYLSMDNQQNPVDFYFGGDDSSGIPLYVDITLTILSDEGMQQIQNLESAGSFTETDLNDLLEQYGNTYIQRKAFLAKPL